jgi:integrase
MCLLSFDTGARPGKQTLSLRWKDVDFTEKVIRFRDTKSGQDHTVPMTQRLREALQARHSCR